MSTILLTIGSNTFAKTNIDKAKRMLTFLFPDIVFSEPILTEPEEEKYSYLFRNVLAAVDTDMRPDEVIDKIKQTERAVGRTPRDKYLGKVIIDIDLIKYGDEILRPQDYEREYVQRLLSTIEIPEKEDTPVDTGTQELPDQPDSSGVPAPVDDDIESNDSDFPESDFPEDDPQKADSPEVDSPEADSPEEI